MAVLWVIRMEKNRRIFFGFFDKYKGEGGRRALGESKVVVVSLFFSVNRVQGSNILFYFAKLEGCYRITWLF